MEIKPAWLLEGTLGYSRLYRMFTNFCLSVLLVAPHYFKPADLEQLATGDKKMPNAKAVGASSASTPAA
jgi:hypothetical protein